MQRLIQKLRLESNKLAAVSAVWIAVIISSSVLLGETGTFVQLLPVLCLGGFLSMVIEIYTGKVEEE
jgi:hypothetical protein